jgi:hypothetical protein
MSGHTILVSAHMACLPQVMQIFFLETSHKGHFYHVIHLLHCLMNFFFFVMSTHSTIPLTTYNFDMFLPTIWGNNVPVCIDRIPSVFTYISSSNPLIC